MGQEKRLSLVYSTSLLDEMVEAYSLKIGKITSIGCLTAIGGLFVLVSIPDPSFTEYVASSSSFIAAGLLIYNMTLASRNVDTKLQRVMDGFGLEQLKIKKYAWKKSKIEKDYTKGVIVDGNIASSMVEIETIDHKIAYLRELRTELAREGTRYQYDLISLGSTIYKEKEYQLYNRYKQNKE